MKRALLILAAALALTACAGPGSTTRIPQPVAIALGGGDVSNLPPEAWAADAQVLEMDMHWYDRSWAIQVDKNGDAHFVDITSAANGDNALEARKSDNQVLSSLVEALKEGMALGRAAAAAPGPVP